MEFDDALKLECIKIASQELIEVEGLAPVKKMLKRARDIYLAAYADDIKNWYELTKQNKTVSKEETFEKSVEQTANIIQKTVTSEIKTKKCPLCGEEVSASWKEHKYNSKGQKCGYVWGGK